MTSSLSAASQPDRYKPFEYSQCWWGEMICGTKRELQELGLAPGLAFPGEPGGSKRFLKTIDPRGLPCKIDRFNRDEDIFYARIRYPDRESPNEKPAAAYPGVTVEHLWYSDLYRGRVEAVLDAGLLRAEQLPGAPGLGKTTACFFADGSVMARRQTEHMPEGAMSVSWNGKYRVLLYVYVSPDEREQRYERGLIEQREFESRMWALPRFRPLVPPDRDVEARAQRAQMRLVWSKPVTVPTLTLPPFKY